MDHGADTFHSMRGPIAQLLHDTSILEAVERHAVQRPEKPFLIIEKAEGVSVTSFQELRDKARGFAAMFARSGLNKDDAIALVFTTHPAQAPAFVGAMMAGAIPFMLPTMTSKQDPALFWKAQAATLERVDARLILTDSHMASLLATNVPKLASRVLVVDAADPRGSAISSEAVDHSRQDIAFLQHSSGTTGAKKGVVLTHGMVLDAVEALGTALGIGESDTIASWLPLYHDMGLIACLMLPMVLGLTTVHMDPLEWAMRPVALFEMIERHRATLCWQPNFAFQHLVRTVPRNQRSDLSSMRAFIDCSEPCKPETLQAFRERFASSALRPESVQVCYGMAENVFGVTQTRMNANPRVIDADLCALETGRVMPAREGSSSVAFVSNGPAIPQTTVRIVDENLNSLPDRVVGQIAITSPYLFASYHRSDLAAGKLVAGWYYTGDFGFIDDGELFICGRRDELLIINGRNVYAHDIEFSVNRGTTVKPGRCVAVAPYNPRTGSQSLVVIAETEEEDQAKRHTLAQAVRAVVLSEFGILTTDVCITDVGWLIKTTSGKIARGANESRYLDERRLG